MMSRKIYIFAITLLMNFNSFCNIDTSYDKSNIFFQDSVIYYVEPDSKEEIKILIENAQINKQKIIVQGHRHSANGSSLGSNDEILLNTSLLNNIKIQTDKVVVGSGVILEELDEYLKEKGYKLLTKNEGGKGPTVGGFISAVV